MKARSVVLAGREISPSVHPFVVAEMSGNHNHSLERALAIVDAAADCGADALKLQTYTAETMTLDSRNAAFRVDDPGSLWHGRSLYDLYSEAYTPWDWHPAIFQRCSERGLIAFSTPFDATAVDFLESLVVPAYKIASFEITDLPLIRRVARTGKPLILSTGMATLAEIDEAVSAARAAGCTDLVLLKCTSAYPADPANANLRALPLMQELFGAQVGVSDHTMGLGVAVAAVSFGATVIEKHFTLRRADGGVDSAFSMEPAEMAQLVVEAGRAWQAGGDEQLLCSDAERPSLKYRRSLYVVKVLRAGDVLTADAVRALRPAAGLPPKFADLVVGMRVTRDVPRGTPLTWDLLRLESGSACP